MINPSILEEKWEGAGGGSRGGGGEFGLELGATIKKECVGARGGRAEGQTNGWLP
jgi:hypothetical protein